MEHLTVDELHDLASRIGRGQLQKEALPDHLNTCENCLQELRFQTAMVNALRTHLHTAPRSMKKAVLNRILPPGDSILARILNNGGRVLAMAVVVAVMVYGLTLELPGSSRPGPASELFGQMSSYYNTAKEYLSTHTVLPGSRNNESGERGKILVMTFVVLAGLGLADKFLGHRFIRMKI